MVAGAMIVCDLLGGTNQTARETITQAMARLSTRVQQCIALWRALLITLLGIAPASALADRQQDPELGKLLQQALDSGECFEDRYDQQVWFAAMEPQLKK